MTYPVAPAVADQLSATEIVRTPLFVAVGLLPAPSDPARAAPVPLAVRVQPAEELATNASPTAASAIRVRHMAAQLLAAVTSTGIVNTAPWQVLSEAPLMCTLPATVSTVAAAFAARSSVRPVWFVNVT